MSAAVATAFGTTTALCIATAITILISSLSTQWLFKVKTSTMINKILIAPIHLIFFIQNFTSHMILKAIFYLINSISYLDTLH